MMASAVNGPDGADVYKALAGISKEFADAARHISRSCCSAMVDLLKAIKKGDGTAAGQQFMSLAQSDLVSGVTASFDGLKDKLQKISSLLAPFAGIVAGLTVVYAGVGALKAVGLAVGALLILAGILIAYFSVLKLAEAANGFSVTEF